MVLRVGCGVDVEARRVLVQVAFRQINANYVVDDEVVLLDEAWALLLDHRVVPQVRQGLKPIVKFLGRADLVRPVVDDVKIIEEEVACLGVRAHDEVVLSSLEEPLGLLLLEEDSALPDLIQLDDVARRVREFALAVVRDEHAPDWPSTERL